MNRQEISHVTLSQIVALVSAALTDFYARDRILFRDNDESNSVSERTMAARIGFYLERHLEIIGSPKELSIDLEYNRNFNSPKSIFSSLTQQRCNVIPDLLIHKRNSNDENLLVIEFKKGTPPVRDRIKDEEKLRYFTNTHREYRFRFGMYIELHHSSALIYIFQEGRHIETIYYA